MADDLSLVNSHLLPDLYRAAFDQAHEAFFILDEKGRIIEVNQAACRQLGRTREELLHSDFSLLHEPASVERFSHQLQRLEEVKNADLDAVLLHQDGTLLSCHSKLSSVEHGDRRFILISCALRQEQPACDIEYEKIIQATGEGYWMVNVSNARIIDTNETFCKMVGYTREELLSMTISDLEVVESPEETAEHIRKVVETGHDIFETKHRHKDGHSLEFEVSASYADIRGGVIFIFTRDISERKRQEAMQQLASLVMNESSATVMVTDADNRILSVNPAFTQITGYGPDEVIGRNPNVLSSGKQNKKFYQEMWATLEETGHWEGEWWNRRRNGEEYAEQVNLNLLRDKNGDVYRYVKIAADITEKKLFDDQIWYQANYDAVTGLPNRSLFMDRLAHELKKCDRTGESVALFYIDLDNFKEINDTFGHEIGDILLIEASHRIGSCIRSTDTVARLGGDEFAVLLIDLHDTSRVDGVARKINHMLAQPFLLRDVHASVSGSVGIAIYPEDSLEIKDLIRKADHAMYVAKRSGKNRYNYSERKK
jgi:diguanylate cyclase (GGDEF)-like protein/PAS domain S-box-containing protein